MALFWVLRKLPEKYHDHDNTHARLEFARGDV